MIFSVPNLLGLPTQNEYPDENEFSKISLRTHYVAYLPMNSRQRTPPTLDRQCILVTGGAGYIGSHVCVALLAADYDIVVIDDLSNSSSRVIDRIHSISGRQFRFIQGDISDESLVTSLLANRAIQGVVHLAGFKAVAESVVKPLSYYSNNFGGTLSLLNAMEATGTDTLVFSSSATVYGNPDVVPIQESAARKPESPYGRSKLMVEQLLEDYQTANPHFSVGLLRYFNPVGAHQSGLIGESPKGIPNNLMPYIAQVAIGQREELSVFGGDYGTRDGTCERDYVHVVDLALGHVSALNYLLCNKALVTLNLGTGKPISVLAMIDAFESACGVTISRRMTHRRSGDVPAYWANVDKAYQLLEWKAEKGLADMCLDTWRWQMNNPRGYE